MHTCIAYMFIAIACTIACAIDGLLFPGGQEWFVLWGISAFGMLACAFHSIVSE